jgi:hypothetical protein
MVSILLYLSYMVWYNVPLYMVDVAQSVRALVCGTRGCGFESHLPPHFPVCYLMSCVKIASTNPIKYKLFIKY